MNDKYESAILNNFKGKTIINITSELLELLKKQENNRENNKEFNEVLFNTIKLYFIELNKQFIKASTGWKDGLSWDQSYEYTTQVIK